MKHSDSPGGGGGGGGGEEEEDGEEEPPTGRDRLMNYELEMIHPLPAPR